MAKRRKKSKSSCPEPINTFIDLCGGAATALITRSMLKRDIEKGEGDESLAAAAMVFGSRALRKGDAIGIGGMIGINSALKSTQRQPMISNCIYSPEQEAIPHISTKKPSQEQPRYIWRRFCADGSQYGIYPEDYETADEYEEALAAAKSAYNHITPTQEPSKTTTVGVNNSVKSDPYNKYIWRKYCTDGAPYGLCPKDFETADDYEEAIQRIKTDQKSKSSTD